MLRDMKRIGNLGFLVFPFFPGTSTVGIRILNFILRLPHTRLSSFEKNMTWECTKSGCFDLFLVISQEIETRISPVFVAKHF